MSGVHGDIIPATARRCGSSARKWGVLPGLSDKTNGLPTDDMSMREDTRTQYSPASPCWGLRGRKRRLLRNPQNSSGAKVATGARNAAPHTRRSWGLRACREVNVQSLVAAVASFRFQAGELAFLFSFLAFLLPGHGSSFLRRAFSFCLNRCLRRSGRKRAAVSLLDDRFAADGHGGAGARVGGPRPRELSTKDARKSTSVPGKPRNAVRSYPVALRRRSPSEDQQRVLQIRGSNGRDKQWQRPSW